jgi:anaerobic magnesium-protoporphyrin IX monomethyl ester cyclase
MPHLSSNLRREPPRKVPLKVLFVTPPYHCGVVEVAGRWIPLQFVYLAGAARAAGFDCEIYDAMSLDVGHDEIGRKLDAARPDVVCVSAITATYPDSLEVARAAKERGAITILGGVHPTFMWRETLADGVDYVVCGEGERTLVELLRCLDAKDDPAKVAGVAFVRDGVAGKTNARPKLESLDGLPMAFDLLDWSPYTYFVKPGSRLGAVSTSRGCTYTCGFCSQTQFWEKTWRARAPECVAAEIADLKERYGVDVVLLTDEYPTSDRARWEAFLDRMIALDLKVDLLMETRVPDIIRDRDILPKYVKAGIVHVYVGIEATDQDTLNLVNKETTVDENKLALQLLSEHDLVSETSFVLGFPHETPEKIERTLALAKEYDPDFAHFLAIAPWPYAAMWKDLEPYVVSHDWRRYNLIDPVVKPTAMTIREIDDAIIDCYRKFYFSKGKQLLAMRPGFRREYVFRSMKLIMQSSFVKKKMLGRAMPEEVKSLLAALGRQVAS